MAINRLFPVLALLGLAGAAAYAQPLTLLVGTPQLARPDTRPPQNCLIGTKNCQSLSKAPWRPCLVDTKPCPRTGGLIGASPTVPRK
jgi:hypothetical protein